MKVKQIVESGTLIREASAEDKSSKRFRAKIIEAGQGSSAFYPARVLEDYASVFKAGTHMYFDHPTFSEEFERPERSVKDLVGKLVTDATYENEALYAEVEFYPWVADSMAEMMSDIGLSIRAYGTAEESDDADAPTPVLTSFVEVLSVDVVTKAGAGGALLEMLESAREKTLEDVKKDIKENRMNEEQEALLKQVAESLNSLTESLKPVVESYKAPEAPAAGNAPDEDDTVDLDPIEAAKALAASGLTEKGQAQALEAAKAGKPLEEAIKEQKDYEDAIAEAAKKPTGVHVHSESGSPKPFNGFKKVGN